MVSSLTLIVTFLPIDRLRISNVPGPKFTTEPSLIRTSRYAPGANVAVPQEPGLDTANLVHAADIWYSVKKNWCLSARRRLDATRDTR